MCSLHPQISGEGGGGGSRDDVQPNVLCAWITVQSSKTIRNHTRVARIKIPVPPCSKYCPIAAWRESCALSPAERGAPAFMLLMGAPLSVPQLQSGGHVA